MMLRIVSGNSKSLAASFHLFYALNAASPAIVLGPGTGLGMAALVQSGGRYMALASEAGHVGFASP